MEVLSISWAGVRTQNFAATVRYFVESMGLPLTLRDDEGEVAHFRCASGDLFEIFGPNNPYARHHACPVFAFQVADIGAARREMERKGVEFVTDIDTWGGDDAWCYFRGPDGYLYEILQKGPPKAG
jgi:catechol 2,3-dioxygenase-like lactoylglutathione lyase family enzyme